MTIDMLLPPGSTPMEHAVGMVGANALDIAAPVETLLNPETIEASLLPWLAGSLGIDRWSPDWSEAQKRAEIAGSIARQRIKGTPASVRSVLEASNALLKLVEWHQMMPAGLPHTFDIRLPQGHGLTVEAVEALVADVLRDVGYVKPMRSHARFVHLVEGEMGVYPIIAMRGLSVSRVEATVGNAAALDWASFLQTRNGEPIETAQGGYLQ